MYQYERYRKGGWVEGWRLDIGWHIGFCFSTVRKVPFWFWKLHAKIEVLEKSLSQVIKEFETERQRLIEKYRIETESTTIELKKLRKTLELKTNEMNKVKKLGKTIIEQRSDIERFFLDSLDYVKLQVSANR